eukprot:TRINITY_DN14029_c0_g1_i1.p1 TRINITY_DN14029_c0_g1~~TRINITY_DN14029_c0_g1_i1.p1  ORF type:complete len:415 (-),score=40.96 TRINITY_DN14029_c0_g1_i1:63-1274(-)
MQTARVISMFNHKGGVAKTTTTFSIGWEMARKGRIVVMVDCDAQCNLSQLVLQNRLEGKDLNFDDYYSLGPNNHGLPVSPNNLRDALLPIIDDLFTPIAASNLATVVQFPNGGHLYLLAGHPDITRFEEKLSLAYGSLGMINARSLSAFADMITLTSQSVGANAVLLDLSPSIQPFNRNLLMMSDFFIVPCAPDYFSYEALRSLQRVLPEWRNRDVVLRQNLSVNIPFQPRSPQFLGAILLRYTQRQQTPAKNFRKWINQVAVQIAGVQALNVSPNPIVVNNVPISGLIQALRSVQPHMTLTDQEYAQIVVTPGAANSETIQHLNPNHLLAQISDFTQLAALSHIHNRPVNGLESHHMTADEEGTGQQVLLKGNRKEDLWNRVEIFTEIFAVLTDNICTLAQI